MNTDYRTQTLAGSVVLVYPSQVVHIHDRNVITVKSIVPAVDSVGGVFYLSSDNGTATIEYNSERRECTFDLLSVFYKLAPEGMTNVSVSGSVIYGDNAADITPFTLRCENGRTLHSRPHASERVIYFDDPQDLNGLQIYSSNGGMIDGYPLNAGVTKLNMSWHSGPWTATVVDGTETYKISFEKSNLGGEGSGSGDGEAGCNSSEDSGEGEDNTYGVLRVRYVNTDGCFRYATGKVTQRKRTITQSDWRLNEMVRNTPNALITGHTDTWKCVFPSMKRLSYFEDIIYSPRTEYFSGRGTWEPCILADKSVTLDQWDENDVEITFQTLS